MRRLFWLLLVVGVVGCGSSDSPDDYRLCGAVMRGEIAQARELLEQGKRCYDRGEGAIHLAAGNGDLEMVKMLVGEYGLFVDQRVAPRGWQGVNNDVLGGRDHKDRISIKYWDYQLGPFEPAVFYSFETPLIRAYKGAERDVVLYLLEKGADPRAMDAHGYSVYEDALKRERVLYKEGKDAPYSSTVLLLI